jgi:hypothetical protein
MTDREQLELASKACGLEEAKMRIEFNQWNPLTDDGDALRLAVKLHLLTTECVEDWKWCRDKTEHADVCASYRRAITRAAAEIGRSMT